MGVMQREQSNKYQRNRIFLYDLNKIMKNKKINQKKKKLTMMYLCLFFSCLLL